MGIFTWTDARRKPRLKKNGYDYLQQDVIGYSGFAKVVAPDGTEYKTNYYDGYGRFGTEDVYDLVVDWNKEDLCLLAKKHEESSPFSSKLARMLGEGKTEEQVTRYVKKHIGDDEGYQYLLKEWKRNIGIMIACDDEDNESLRYPIKITSSKRKYSYDELYPSYSTQ